jgi:hypothetical protein
VLIVISEEKRAWNASVQARDCVSIYPEVREDVDRILAAQERIQRYVLVNMANGRSEVIAVVECEYCCLWDVKTNNLADNHRHFERACYLQLQDRRIMEAEGLFVT